MIWFTSDTHFGHENVLKFTDRPWETIQQMNSVIVANINARVGMNDELYILGDFSFKMTAQDAYGLRKKITCKKVHLVPGNHDKVDYVVTHEAPADLAGDLCWECNRPFEDDPLQNFLGEIDRRLDFKTWFFGHYHDDEWRDGRHRLIYRDIVPVGVRREDEDREPVG